MTTGPTVLRAGNASPEDHAAAATLARNEEARLSLVRTRSEKWVGGLTTLTGLLGTVLVLKGPDSVTALPVPVRIVFAALVATALGLLLFATYRAHQSAYGDPGVLDELSPSPVTGLAERLAEARRNAAAAAQNHLRHAVLATFAGIAVLVLATGLTWFGARSAAAPPGSICVTGADGEVLRLAGRSVTVESAAAGLTIRAC